MNYLFARRVSRIAIASIVLTAGLSAYAQRVRRMTTFATGSAVNATGPDSVTLSKNSVWVSYTNGADSTGLSGSSTIVQYKLNGEVRHTYSIAGSVDGLKVDPRNGHVWALQNQDGNSTLSVINPKTHTVAGPIPYAVKSATEGYDDVVFRSGWRITNRRMATAVVEYGKGPDRGEIQGCTRGARRAGEAGSLDPRRDPLRQPVTRQGLG